MPDGRNALPTLACGDLFPLAPIKRGRACGRAIKARELLCRRVIAHPRNPVRKSTRGPTCVWPCVPSQSFFLRLSTSRVLLIRNRQQHSRTFDATQLDRCTDPAGAFRSPAMLQRRLRPIARFGHLRTPSFRRLTPAARITFAFPTDLLFG